MQAAGAIGHLKSGLASKVLTRRRIGFVPFCGTRHEVSRESVRATVRLYGRTSSESLLRDPAPQFNRGVGQRVFEKKYAAQINGLLYARILADLAFVK